MRVGRPGGWIGCIIGSRVRGRRWRRSWLGGRRWLRSWPGAGILDPASSLLLLDAAHRARTASESSDSSGLAESSGSSVSSDEQRESALTRAINATGTEVEPWAGELSLAMRRVQLARRFHNDIVVSTRDLRRRRLVSWLRLAGHAPMPSTIELEDGVELRLSRPSGIGMSCWCTATGCSARTTTPRRWSRRRSSVPGGRGRVRGPLVVACLALPHRHQRLHRRRTTSAASPPVSARACVFPGRRRCRLARTCLGCSRSPTYSWTVRRSRTRSAYDARRSNWRSWWRSSTSRRANVPCSSSATSSAGRPAKPPTAVDADRGGRQLRPPTSPPGSPRTPPPHRSEWSATSSTAVEQDLLRKYMAAWDAGDPDGPGRAHARRHPHHDAAVPLLVRRPPRRRRSLAANLDPTGNAYRGHWRFLPTTLNHQPTLAAYLNPPAPPIYRPFAFDIFRTEQGLIAEITAFEITDFPTYGLPPRLPPKGTR